MAACIIGYLVPALALHDEALEFSPYSMVQEQGTSRSNSLSSISIFLLVQFLRQNDASTPFFYLPLFKHATCQPSGFRTLAALFQYNTTIWEFH